MWAAPVDDAAFGRDRSAAIEAVSENAHADVGLYPTKRVRKIIHPVVVARRPGAAVPPPARRRTVEALVALVAFEAFEAFVAFAAAFSRSARVAASQQV